MGFYKYIKVAIVLFKAIVFLLTVVYGIETILCAFLSANILRFVDYII